MEISDQVTVEYLILILPGTTFPVYFFPPTLNRQEKPMAT